MSPETRGAPLVWNGKKLYFFAGTTPVNHKDARAQYDGRGNLTGYALRDGTPVRMIRDTFKGFNAAERHECGPRCMGATGPNCECSCGGANHGAGA